VAWGFAGAWGVWALARLTGVDRLTPLGMPAAPMLAFTPYAAATAPIPLLVAGLLRRRWAALASGAIAAGLAVLVLPRAVGADQPAAHGPVVRVMTVNLLFGQADPARLIDLVRRGDVDVLSLQELTHASVERYETAGLSRLLPFKVVQPGYGAEGSALYARHPLRELPPLGPTVMATPRAEVLLAGRRVEVVAVHPIPPITSAAYRQWRRDLGLLPAAATDPIRILAGDFNATLDHAALRTLLSRGYADAADRTGDGLVHTWGPPAGRPPLTIDHVLADRRCAVRHVQVHDVAGSDHRAVLAELQLP
jgi:endonuclease/exonuclease/phosphatase (EEP) superfamily protein YafD